MPLVSFLLATLPTDAHAVMYSGNPVLWFRVDRPADDYVEGSVELEKVRVHHCGGGYTDYPVEETLDPVEVNSVAIDPGDHCGLTFHWGSAMDVDGYGALGAFTVRYAQATTAMELAVEIEPVALTPYSVVSGSMSGGSPWLMATIQ